MKVLIKEFKVKEALTDLSTLHFSCNIKLSPEYFQTLQYDTHREQHLEEHAERIGEFVKQEIIKYVLNKNKDE